MIVVGRRSSPRTPQERAPSASEPRARPALPRSRAWSRSSWPCRAGGWGYPPISTKVEIECEEPDLITWLYCRRVRFKIFFASPCVSTAEGSMTEAHPPGFGSAKIFRRKILLPWIDRNDCRERTSGSIRRSAVKEAVGGVGKRPVKRTTVPSIRFVPRFNGRPEKTFF